MKRILLSSFLMIGIYSFSQENCTSLKNENDYLKKVLDINKPVSEMSSNQNSFKVTKIVGDKLKKTISFTLLLEAQDANKKYHIDDISIFDLEGNEIGIDFAKSDSTFGNLVLNIPKKTTLIFAYKNIESIDPKILKLLKFKFRYTLETNSWEEKKIPVEFRNLNVN